MNSNPLRHLVNVLRSQAKPTLSRLVVAQRPLSLTEIQLLAGPDARKESLTASTVSKMRSTYSPSRMLEGFDALPLV